MKTRKFYSKKFTLDPIAQVREQNDNIPETARNL